MTVQLLRRLRVEVMQVLDAFVAPASRGGERRSTENANDTWLLLNEAVTLSVPAFMVTVGAPQAFEQASGAMRLEKQ